MAKNSGKNTGIKNLKPWKEGETGNPNGRPLGQKNYATLYREALIKLAEANDTTPDDLELSILRKGIMNARSGDYRFYKDLLDRLHGSAPQTIDLKGDINTNNFTPEQQEQLLSLLNDKTGT